MSRVASGLGGSDPREGARRSIAWAGLNTDAYRFRDNTAGRVSLWRDLQDGPAIILEVLALDSLSQRREVSKSKPMADGVHRAVQRFTQLGRASCRGRVGPYV